MGRGCMSVFFGLFLVAGLFIIYTMTVRPLWMTLVARSWEPAEAVVLSSEVGVHSGDDSDTYSIEITYRYHFQGRAYVSGRYSFHTGSSSGWAGKNAVVARYPVGSTQECFVNPRAPEQAVLVRTPTSQIWWGLIGLPFAVVGSLVFFVNKPGSQLARSLGARSTPVPLSASLTDSATGGSGVTGSGVVELRPATSRKLRVFGMLFAAVFWNGLVSVFVFHAFESFQVHEPEWGLTLFLVPFVLVGLGLLGFFLYQLLGLWNPTLRVTSAAGGVPLGEELALEWAFTGQTGRLQSLSIVLEGEESATYRRGTDTLTDRSVFARLPVLETSSSAEIASGSARVRLPANSMHTFGGGNNAIAWKLHFHGVIPRFPDVVEDYEIEVWPLPNLTR